MVASIGPFWDANETWLVLGVGILLVAFPQAHGVVLGELYLPVALMLVGPDLARRGLRLPRQGQGRAQADLGPPVLRRLDARRRCRRAGCSGRYVSGFGTGWNYPLFAAAIALALPMAYVLLGAAWLIMKTEGELQERPSRWARIAWAPMVGGLVLISMATPWISANGARALVRAARDHRADGHSADDRPGPAGGARPAAAPARVRGPLCWLPFALLIVVFVLGFLGPGLQHLPVRRDRPADDLAGGQQPAGAEGDPASACASRCRRSPATRCSRTGCSAARRESSNTRSGCGRYLLGWFVLHVVAMLLMGAALASAHSVVWCCAHFTLWVRSWSCGTVSWVSRLWRWTWVSC